MQEVLGATNLVSQGNKLQATFNVHFTFPTPTGFGATQSLKKITKYSAKYIINRLCFETRATLTKDAGAFGPQNHNQLFVRFTKQENDDAVYIIHLISKNLLIDKKFISDDTEWRLICENNQLDYTFDVSVQVDTFKLSDRGLLANFATLHNDTLITDFELRGEDGSIHIHSAVLAAFSPVLRRMLEGKWKETEDRVLEIPETTHCTLQLLKDYLYLDVLPETGIHQLLLLASCYMMEDLKRKCLDKIISNINAQNAVEITKFALTHNIMELYFSLLECIQSKSINVEDVRECNK